MPLAWAPALLCKRKFLLDWGRLGTSEHTLMIMSRLKMFSGGGSGGGSSGGQSQMIGMAMSEASKLFDQQNGMGNVQGGTDKQSAVNSAAKMAFQMYMKSQGGGGGGASGLMSLASKFF